MSKISELSDGGVIQGGDTLIAVRSGGNVKVTYGGSTTANIDGGTIDGTVIGGTTTAAGSFTTLQADTSLNVDGTVTADGLTVDGTANVKSSGGKSTISIGDTAASTYAQLLLYGGATKYNWMAAAQYNANNGFEITPSTATEGVTFSNPALRIDFNRDISFFEDTGTTAKLFWDSSAESLGIGTDSPATRLHLSGGDPSIRLTPSGTNDARIDFTNNAGTVQYYTGFDESSGHYIIADENGFAGSNVFTFTSAGNVGIGTDSPSVALQVESSTAQSGRSLRLAYDGSYYTEIAGLGAGGVSYNTVNATAGGHRFEIDGSEKMRIDFSGNAGLGVVPESWYSSYTALQIGASGALSAISSGNENVGLSSNTYLATDGNFKYIATNEATRYLQSAGVHYWYTAASGTADTNVTFSQNMTLDASGNLLVGKTSSDIGTNGFEATSSGITRITRTSATANTNPALIINRKSSDGPIVDLKKDGSPVGSIGTVSGDVTIDGGSEHTGLRFEATDITPRHNGAASDGVNDLGTSGARFKDLYLSGGVRNVNSDGINFGTSSGEPNIVPVNNGSQVDGQGSIGTSSNRWKDLYLSGGAYLGGTAAANKLDDYEEGTFTPVLTGSTSGTINGVGRYTKVGNLVSVEIDFTFFNGTVTGDVTITGMPFSKASDTQISVFSLSGTRISFDSAKIPVATMQDSTSVIDLVEMLSSGVGTAMTGSGNFPSGTSKYFYVSGSYRTA